MGFFDSHPIASAVTDTLLLRGGEPSATGLPMPLTPAAINTRFLASPRSIFASLAYQRQHNARRTNDFLKYAPWQEF
ncbi:hypothetical protein [Sinorhizobium mexicanum]|uniref:Uncharacterized protein n=1 Tax=Sinorhizobium mexicanum TaxID=375549 RepID=A0A859QY44_9HYPH|nr:hypothetical protein [Sinorhizobium mexicanum]MBP1888331.1 hypothetical protein [Sinorhizobium mexicanum]QLL64409.1 hypothetical protein FKV68_23560 [Sinorhizobium mexicanum]